MEELASKKENEERFSLTFVEWTSARNRSNMDVKNYEEKNVSKVTNK